jgi:hypothetical protein
MGEITASDDVTKSAVLYNRLAKVGKGVLTAHEKDISPAVRESIQQDVARDALNAMQRYMEGGAYQNLDLMLAFCKGITWFSENQKAAKELHRLKWELQRGNTAGVELKAREWLELCKERGWAKEKTLAARILSAINSS